MTSNNRSRPSRVSSEEPSTNHTVNGSQQRRELQDRNFQQQGPPPGVNDRSSAPGQLPDDQYTMQPHAMYHPDHAHHYTESLQTVQQRNKEIHDKQRHQLGDLDHFVKTRPQYFGAHANAHLMPLDIGRHVSNMGTSAPAAPFGPSKPGRLENHSTGPTPQPSHTTTLAPEPVQRPRLVEPLRNDHRRTMSDPLMAIAAPDHHENAAVIPPQKYLPYYNPFSRPSPSPPVAQVCLNHHSQPETLPAVSPIGNVHTPLVNHQQPPPPPAQVFLNRHPQPQTLPAVSPIGDSDAPVFNGQQLPPPSAQVLWNHHFLPQGLPVVSPSPLLPPIENFDPPAFNPQQPPPHFSPQQQQTFVVPLPLSAPEGAFPAVLNPAPPIEHIQAPVFNHQQPPFYFNAYQEHHPQHYGPPQHQKPQGYQQQYSGGAQHLQGGYPGQHPQQQHYGHQQQQTFGSSPPFGDPQAAFPAVPAPALPIENYHAPAFNYQQPPPYFNAYQEHHPQHHGPPQHQQPQGYQQQYPGSAQHLQGGYPGQHQQQQHRGHQQQQTFAALPPLGAPVQAFPAVPIPAPPVENIQGPIFNRLGSPFNFSPQHQHIFGSSPPFGAPQEAFQAVPTPASPIENTHAPFARLGFAEEALPPVLPIEDIRTPAPNLQQPPPYFSPEQQPPPYSSPEQQPPPYFSSQEEHAYLGPPPLGFPAAENLPANPAPTPAIENIHGPHFDHQQQIFATFPAPSHPEQMDLDEQYAIDTIITYRDLGYNFEEIAQALRNVGLVTMTREIARDIWYENQDTPPRFWNVGLGPQTPEWM